MVVKAGWMFIFFSELDGPSSCFRFLVGLLSSVESTHKMCVITSNGSKQHKVFKSIANKIYICS